MNKISCKLIKFNKTVKHLPDNDQYFRLSSRLVTRITGYLETDYDTESLRLIYEIGFDFIVLLKRYFIIAKLQLVKWIWYRPDLLPN